MTLPLPAHVFDVDSLPARVVAIAPKATLEAQILTRNLVGHLVGLNFIAPDGSLCDMMGYVLKSTGRQLLIDGDAIWVNGCKHCLYRSFLVDVSHVLQSAPCEAVSALMFLSKAFV
jgi:hypothetical protein